MSPQEHCCAQTCDGFYKILNLLMTKEVVKAPCLRNLSIPLVMPPKKTQLHMNDKQISLLLLVGSNSKAGLEEKLLSWKQS